MALTDHNSCKNCPAFFEAANRHGILPVAGMELTTAEDIHIVCLFDTLSNAMAFDEEVAKHLVKIPNRADIFGNQLICDGEDNIIGVEENLLINATDIGLDYAPDMIASFGGICFPAHIDRASNGVISVLGVFPKSPVFTCAELHNRELLPEFSNLSGIKENKLIISSDAHYLWDIKEKLDYISLEDITDKDKAGEYLLKFLRER
jgi:DNA polymerase III alpha subunit